MAVRALCRFSPGLGNGVQLTSACIMHKRNASSIFKVPPYMKEDPLKAVERLLPEPKRVCFRPRRMIKKKGPDDFVSPFKHLYVEKFRHIFEDHRMLGVYLYSNISTKALDVVRDTLFPQGMKVAVYTRKRGDYYLLTSPFKHMKTLLGGPTLIIYSNEVKVKEMLAATKNEPKLFFLGGCIDRQFLSRESFIAAGKLSSHERLHAELVGGLESHAAHLHSALSSPAQSLAANLEQYIKQNSETTEH